MKGKVGLLLMASVVTVPVMASGETLHMTETEILPGTKIDKALAQRTILSNTTIAAQTPAVQQLVDQLKPAMEKRQSNVTVTYTATADTYEQVLETALQQIFQQDEYLNYDYSGLKRTGTISENQITLNLQFDFKQTYEQEQYVQQEVKRIVAQEITETMSNHEKLKALYDYVVRNIAYDTTYNQAVNAPYFALTEGKTLCNGYAMLMYHLLNEVGIETRLISGEAESQNQRIGHAWNLVNVDGEWYHLDATWGDPIPDQGEKVSYNYYMLTDDQIDDNHFWQEGGLNKREKPYPVATAHYFEALLAADEMAILKDINQWIAPQLIASNEVQFKDALKFQMDRLRTNVEIFYTGNDVETIRGNMTNYVSAVSNYYGDLYIYEPSQISYQNNIVAKFKYDFPNYNLSIASISVQGLPATIAVGEELPLVVTMERSDGEQFEVTDLAEVEAIDPTILKVSHDKIVALKNGVTDVRVDYNGETITERITVQEAEEARDIIPYPFNGYKSFGEKVNVPAMKVWTIHMSQPVTNTYKPEVVVMNQYGDIVEATVDISGKKIFVQPPVAGYTAGETYYLKATFANPALNMSSKFTIE